MIVGRLNWAGALIESSGVRILIDPVYQSSSKSFFGEPRVPFLPMDSIERVDAILLTHLHSDHFDPDCIRQNFGIDIKILVPFKEQSKVKELGFHHVIGMNIGETHLINGVEIIGTHSIDGLGDPQLAWVIRDQDQTIIHCGDTLWHGYWWEISKKYGPFDVAFLPTNGAIISEPGLIDSNQPLCMAPEQAVSAAKILQAKYLIPIHYAAFHNPPHYKETENVTARIQAASNENELEVKWLGHFEKVEL
jgi:L-ascorbate metabolism protein UlaG (beta-lactamase superfamily)